MNAKQNEDFEKLRQELRRGTVVLAVLSQLDQEQYGYSLISSLNEKGFEIGQDTLYPLLRRLEKSGPVGQPVARGRSAPTALLYFERCRP